MKYNNSLLKKHLTGFIKNQSKKIGISKAVIGLSGGIDSTVASYLAAEALGNENVLCVLMPYKTSSKTSITDALKVVRKLGVRCLTVEITEVVDAYLSKVNDKEISNIRKGNVMARVRMIILYDLSARENAIVIGTGNKTETLLGYSTIYGDSACAINAIGDLYKTQIWDLAKYLKVPQSIIDKKPSADLWEGQTDENEMGLTYKKVDKYLYQKFDLKKTKPELLKMGYTKEYIAKVDSMIAKNRFKRFPPVVFKIPETLKKKK